MTGPWKRQALLPAVLLAWLVLYSTAVSAQDDRVVLPLDHAAERIYALAEQRLLVVSTGQLELVDTSNGKTLSALRFETPLLSVSPIAATDGPPRAMLLVGPHDGSSTARVFTLRQDNDRLAIDQASPGELSRLMKPAILPFAAEGVSAVAWDRDLSSYIPQYQLVGSDGPRIVDTKQPAQELVGIGSEMLVMGLHPADARVSLLDPLTGETEDFVSVLSISASDRARLAVFSPGAALGGTGDVLVSSGETGRLTHLSIGPGKFPRLADPVQIIVPTTGAPAEVGGPALLAAADDLSVIVLGHSGSTELQVFQSSGRALKHLGAYPLASQPKDLVVLPAGASGAGAQQMFVLLHADGKSIELVPADAIRQAMLDTPALVGDDTAVLGADDVTSIQRVLAYLGYAVGAIDGASGPSTQAAVRAFQFDREIEASGEVDSPTLGLLNAALKSIAVVGRSSPDQEDAYRAYMSAVLPGVDVSRLLYLGNPHERPDAQCFGLNTLPPKLLWANSVPLARLLDALHTDYSLSPRVVSAYRNSIYDSCVGAAASSSHLSFAAIDLAPAEDDPNAKAALLAALEDLKRSGRFDVEVKDENSQFIHVALLQRPIERPTVYLQFAGGARTKAQQLSERLSYAGFSVPGEERSANAAGRREVLYFHEEDRSVAQALAESTAQELSTMGYPAEPAVAIVDMISWTGEKPRPGILELWVEM